MCVINPRNADSNYLSFDGNQKLITVWQLYHENDNIIEMLKNSHSWRIYKLSVIRIKV